MKLATGGITVKNADHNTFTRMRAMMSEIQNPLSAIATLSAIFSRSDTFSPALMFSLDEVSVLMNDNFNEKPTVMLSKEIFDFFETYFARICFKRTH